MPRNNSIVGSVIGLIIFLGFGVFFLVGLSPFSFIGVMPFFPMIFVFIIIGIVGAASASSRRSTCCSPKAQNPIQYYTSEVPRSNPYIVKASSSSAVRPIYIEDTEQPKANFCQFCGTKRDENAMYCYNCGTKL